MSAAAKLLAIVALVLTSFGMSAAPAAAAAAHHGMTAGMPMEHCPDEGGSDGQTGVPECAMACSAALPAVDLPQPQPVAIICAPERRSLARSLYGLQPETEPPPPKES